jgi:hypothetical protein
MKLDGRAAVGDAGLRELTLRLMRGENLQRPDAAALLHGRSTIGLRSIDSGRAAAKLEALVKATNI